MSATSTCINSYKEGKKIVFFGAGQYSKILGLQSIISYFCDNSPIKHNTIFYGRPVFPVDKLLEENKANTIIIINTEHYREIANQLFSMGFENIYSNEYKQANEKIPKDVLNADSFLKRKAKAISYYDIRKVKNLFTDKCSIETFDKIIDNYNRENFDFSEIQSKDAIYFNNIFRNDLSDNEVYIDAGTYDGKTIIDFIVFTGGKYKKIYAFEPDLANYSQLSKEFSNCNDIIITQAGLFDFDGEASFDMRGTQSSKISSNDKNKDCTTIIKTIKLDSFTDEPVTFIKMDIEGAEQNALSGAKETIKKHKPKLAISVYHEDDDLVKIPLLIHEMVPEYKFYLRHHTASNVDTVLYAKI